jgi:hypothetical protein
MGGTGTVVVAAVSRGFTGTGGIDGPSGIVPSAIPPSGSAGIASDLSRGGSGVDQVNAGGAGASSTLGEGMGGSGRGIAGGAAAATAGLAD